MPRRDCKLSQLPMETQEEMVSMALRSRLKDVVDALAENGIKISASAVSRFLQRYESARLKENAAEDSEMMGDLAAGRDRKRFRKGTLAVLQQRLYDEAILTRNTEKLKEYYQMVAAEEDRAENLDLQRRKVELAELNAQVGRKRVELEAMHSALALLPRLSEILNAGGDAAEKVVAARRCLMEGGAKLLLEKGGG